MINGSSMKQSGCDVHVFQLAFEHIENILNTDLVIYPKVVNSGHFLFSGEIAKLDETLQTLTDFVDFCDLFAIRCIVGAEFG